MRLTSFTDYSLRVLIYVACAPEGQATIAQVANAFAISENHLVKVVHMLGREGFLVNTRGRGGGLRLARPARAIVVGEVVRAAEGADVPAECFDPQGARCAIGRVCRLRGVLARAVEAFHEVLDSCTVEDLIDDRGPVASVLHRLPRLQ